MYVFIFVYKCVHIYIYINKCMEVYTWSSGGNSESFPVGTSTARLKAGDPAVRVLPPKSPPLGERLLVFGIFFPTTSTQSFQKSLIKDYVLKP